MKSKVSTHDLITWNKRVIFFLSVLLLSLRAASQKRNDLLQILKADKQKVVSSKRNIENSLSLLQLKYQDVEFQSDEFKEIKEKRSKLKEEAAKVELEIRSINEEISAKNKLKNEVVFFLKNNQDKELTDSKVMLGLKQLKNKYASFSKDKTRVSSMRVMAAEFRDEIETLISKV